MRKSKFESMAIDIYNWCKDNWLWHDTAIYFDGKAWATWPEWEGIKGKKIDDELYEYENKNPLDYFEYANPDTLSMSFEGSLYHVLNAYVDGWVSLSEQFYSIFKRHGYYYELGHSWNLSAYEL